MDMPDPSAWPVCRPKETADSKHPQPVLFESDTGTVYKLVPFFDGGMPPETKGCGQCIGSTSHYLCAQLPDCDAVVWRELSEATWIDFITQRLEGLTHHGKS